MLESVDRHQQLDDSVRDRRARGLDHKHVRLTDVLIDLDEHVLVGETDESRAAEVGPQTFADGLGQFWMSGAADDLDSPDHVAPPVHVRPPRRLAVASDLGRLGGSLARSRSGRNLKLTAVAVNGYARFGRALAVNCSLSLMRRVCDPHER